MALLNYRRHQVGAIFEIFFISLWGFGLPIILSSYSSTKDGKQSQSQYNIINSDIFRIGRSFSTGIIIGLAIMHLLADASSVDLLGDGYPMTFAIALLAILLMIGFEQLSIVIMASLGSKNKIALHSSESMSRDTHISKYVDGDGNTDVKIEMKSFDQSTAHPVEIGSSNGHSHGHSQGHSHRHLDSDDVKESQTSAEMDGKVDTWNHRQEPSHIHAHSMDLILDDSSSRAFIKAVIMEFSIAIHSVIIGVDLGLLTADDLPTIQALMIALAFHQFFEGFSLGTMVLAAKFNLPSKLFLGVFFASTLPVGIVIGMTTSTTTNGDIAKDVANAFAAGSLLYNGMIEMAAEDFADPLLTKRPILKLQMYVSMFLGATFMALLAYWA